MASTQPVYPSVVALESILGIEAQKDVSNDISTKSGSVQPSSLYPTVSSVSDEVFEVVEKYATQLEEMKKPFKASNPQELSRTAKKYITYSVKYKYLFQVKNEDELAARADAVEREIAAPFRNELIKVFNGLKNRVMMTYTRVHEEIKAVSEEMDTQSEKRVVERYLKELMISDFKEKLVQELSGNVGDVTFNISQRINAIVEFSRLSESELYANPDAAGANIAPPIYSYILLNGNEYRIADQIDVRGMPSLKSPKAVRESLLMAILNAQPDESKQYQLKGRIARETEASEAQSSKN